MTMRPALAEDAAAPAEPADWRSLDDGLLQLGLDWVDRLLTGEGAEMARVAYEAGRAAMIERGTPGSMDRLGAAFGLSPFEEDALLLALAAEIDGSFGPRYGAAQGRLTAAPASPHLLARLLFGMDRLPRDAAAALGSAGRLRRLGLIELGNANELAVTAPISVPARIRDLLCGIDAGDPALAAFARALPAVPLSERLEALATRLAGEAPRPLRLQVVGPQRSGRRGLAAALLLRLGSGALEVEAQMLAPAERAALCRECLLGSLGVVYTGDDPAMVAALERELPVPLVIVSAQASDTLAAIPVARLPPMAPAERLAIWTQALGMEDATGMALLAEHFALGPTQIAAVASQPGRDVWAACREVGSSALEAVATRITPERGWADMVLARETLAELRGLAAQVAQRTRVLGEWGYRGVLGRATGISALFAGPSGVGKTMAAEVIAGALSLDLFTVDLARVTSKFIGETEKNLARVFDAAEATGCVLFFDEADALFGKRSEVKDSHDRYANGEISFLLQRMESYGGLAILATNLKSHLDTAFLRRLRVIIDFPIPDVPARRALWQRALPETAPQDRIDLAALARHELTGGNITTIATNAAFRAADEGVPIGMEHLHAAMAAEYRKLDRDPSGLAGGGR